MDSEKQRNEHSGSSDGSSALLHTMKVAVEELNYMIAFQGDMSVNLVDADARKRALHAKTVLENTKDRIVNRMLNEADQLSK